MLEKFHKQNENQMRLSQVAKERSDEIKYDVRMCLFPELSQDDVCNLSNFSIIIDIVVGETDHIIYPRTFKTISSLRRSTRIYC